MMHFLAKAPHLHRGLGGPQMPHQLARRRLTELITICPKTIALQHLIFGQLILRAVT